MINQINIIGSLGRDPEARQTKSGAQIVTFSVATNHSAKNQSGEYEKKTIWHRVKCFGKTGENCMKYLRKGKKVFVTGRQENGHYEKDGQRINTSEIIGFEVKFLSPKDERGSQGGGYTSPYDSAPQSGHQAPGNDDIPF